MSARSRMATHVHSAWSYDGSWTLPDLAEGFSRRGYRVVLMCEHSQTFSAAKWQEYRHACAEASRPDLLLVPGIEYADEDDVLHIPVWGDVPFFGPVLRPGPLLESVRSHDGAAVLAHPNRRDAWGRLDPEWLTLLNGLEIWNRKYDGWAPRSDAVELSRSKSLHPFVSLDFHNRRQFFPLAMVASFPDGVNESQVVAAVRDGVARPQLLRLPVERLTGGAPRLLARAFEGARRLAAPLGRRILR